MDGNNRKRDGSAAGLRLARVLAVLLLITLPLAFNAFTGAKYVAGAGSTAGARVAIWDVRLDTTGLPATKATATGIPDNGTAAGHPLVLFFEGRTADRDGIGTVVEEDGAFTMKFINDSEVAARFIPEIEVKTPTGTSGLAAVKACIKFYDAENDPDHEDDFSTTGLVLAVGETRDVDVVITSCTFTGLKIGATIQQVD